MEHQGHVATKGFAQTFGLHPAVAVLTLTVDAMLGTLSVVSFGTLEVISLLAAVPLGVITFMSQRKWYGDDVQSALIKS